jgi:hypothetical protein
VSVGWVALALAVVVFVVTVLCALGVIKENGVVGIRTPATKRSLAAWTRAHRSAARLLLPGSALIGALGAALGSGWHPGGLSASAAGIALLFAFAAIIFASAFVANRAALRA